MRHSSFPLRFDKEQPGATLTFQPEDLSDYDEDEWEVRVSIGDAPLEEAFYMPMPDPSTTGLPLKTIIREYVTNLDLAATLDVEDNPDLPFLQQEILQYVQNGDGGTLKVDFYVNKCSIDGPAHLDRPARDYLSTCYYDDQSLDYRLLDLVLVASVPDAPSYEVENLKRTYGAHYLLTAIDTFHSRGKDGFQAFCAHSAMSRFLGGSGSGYTSANTELSALQRRGYLKREYLGHDHAPPYSLELTDAGKEKASELKKRMEDLWNEYAPFGSVDVAPPALGVPGGFDVRVQMMEFDGLDCMESVLLCVLHENSADYFTLDACFDVYEDGEFLAIVQDALAFKTNFSAEVLHELKRIAGRE